MDSSFDSAPWNDAAWNDALYLEALRNGFVMDEDPLGVSPFHEAPLALSDLAFFNEAISGPNPVDKVPTGLVPFDDASPTLIPSNSASSSLNQSVSSDVPTSPAPSSQDSELPSPLSLEYAAAPAKNLPAPTVVYLMYDESYYKNFGEKKSTQGGTLEDAFESLDDANYACWYKFHDWDKSEMRLYKQEFDEEGKLEIDVLYPCGLGCRTYIVFGPQVFNHLNIPLTDLQPKLLIAAGFRMRKVGLQLRREFGDFGDFSGRQENVSDRRTETSTL